MSTYIFVMLMVFLIESLHSLDYNDQNEVKHYFFTHWMLLAPALLSCNFNCISNCTILFIMWRQLKQGVTRLFWSCDVVGTTEYHITVISVVPFCLLGEDDWNKIMWCQCQHHMTLTELSIEPLYLIVQDDQNEMHHYFLSHLTLLALASASCDASGTVNSTTVFIRSGQLKQCAT